MDRDPFRVLIAGGTKGIGRAIAKAVARPGSVLFLNYRSDDNSAEQAKAELSATGAKVILVKEDVGSEKGAASIVEKISEQVDGLEGIVHCAAVPNPGSLLTQEMTEVRRAIEVGGLSLLFLVRAAERLLSSGSAVIFLSGPATERVLPNFGALAAAKALGQCLVRYLAIECAQRGINFNTLGSGPVATGLSAGVRGAGVQIPPTPNGQPLQASDVAQVAAFLLSQRASMIRGQSVLVDGGMTMVIRTR